MRTYHFKANYANLTDQVKADYEGWLDRFTRVFCGCLLILEYQGVLPFHHVVMENKIYDTMYLNARHAGDLRAALQHVGVMTDYEITLTTDLLPMVEEFMKLKYITSRQNYLSLYIDHLVNVNVRLTSIPFQPQGRHHG